MISIDLILTWQQMLSFLVKNRHPITKSTRKMRVGMVMDAHKFLKVIFIYFCRLTVTPPNLVSDVLSSEVV